MKKDTRIDKLFSNLGIMSRNECKAAVRAGKVSVNGTVCKSPDEKLDPDEDAVLLNGEPVDSRRTVYYMLYKPAGVITASEDAHSKTVLDLIDDSRTDLAAVGRLDKDTTGILLITNDGDLNHRMLAPRNHVYKTYIARIDGALTESDIRMLERGVDIGDPKPTLPAELRILEAHAPQKVSLTITEGRYHQVKRMFAAVGKPVLALHRDEFGPLKLDPELSPGEYRELTEAELAIVMALK